MRTAAMQVPDLPHITEVDVYDEVRDRGLFDELKAVLEKHKAASRFGVTLLHQHFSLASNEVLCESTDSIARIQEVRPIPKASLADEPHIVTSWRLDLQEPLMACVCKPINGHGHYHQP